MDIEMENDMPNESAVNIPPFANIPPFTNIPPLNIINHPQRQDFLTCNMEVEVLKISMSDKVVELEVVVLATSSQMWKKDLMFNANAKSPGALNNRLNGPDLE